MSVNISELFMAIGDGEARTVRRLDTWDALHGEIEVFNARGLHLGSIDPVNGSLIKEPVQGRRIDV